MINLLNESQLIEAMVRIDTSFVRDRINKLKNQIIKIGEPAREDDRGRSIKIADILNKTFKDEKIVFKYESGGSKYGIVGGFAKEDHIEVYFNSSLAYELSDDEFWNEFLAIVEGTIHHEMVHRGQIVRANIKHPGISRKKIGFDKDLDTWEQYYGSPHEIMAYATSVYYEMIEFGMSHEVMRKTIRSGNLAGVSDVYKEYESMFPRGHKVLNRLLKHVGDIVG